MLCIKGDLLSYFIELVKITKEDLLALRVLNVGLTRHLSEFDSPKGVIDELLSTLSLLHSYPHNEFFNV